MNRVVHAWVGCALAAVSATGAARAQEVPSAVLGVACEGECRARLRQPGTRVRVISGELDVIVEGDGRGAPAARTRLTTTDGAAWTVTRGPEDPAFQPLPPTPRAAVGRSVMAPVRTSPAATHTPPAPVASATTRPDTRYHIAALLVGLGSLSLAVGLVGLYQRDDAATRFNRAGCLLREGEVTGEGFCRSNYDQVMSWHTAMLTGTLAGGAALVAGVTLIAMVRGSRPAARTATLPRWWMGPGPTPMGGSVGARF